MQTPKKKNKFFLSKSLSMNEEPSFINKLASHTINEQDEIDEQHNKKQQQQPARQVGIFQEFKQKYDQVRKDNLEKRSQIDELQRINKRLQIQLLNINTEFYDRQIKRLRGQVQRHQQQSQNYKFKYFQAENKRKELQASLNVKETELGRLIKQIQVEKVKSAEQKIQLKENEKKYLGIINTVEESSTKSAERYSECEIKLISCQQQLKKVKAQLQSTKKALQKQQKSYKSEQQQHQKTLQKQKTQIQKLSLTITQLQSTDRTKQKQISALKQHISALNLDLSKSKSLLSFQTNKTYEKILQFRSSKILQIENKKYKQQLDMLKKQLQQKFHSLKTVEHRINEAKQEMEIQKKQYQQKIKQMGSKKDVIEKHYESKLKSLNKQIESLRIKCAKLQSELDHQNNNTQNFARLLPISSHQTNNDLSNAHIQFQNLLKSKQNEISHLKQSLQQRTDQTLKFQQSFEDQQLHFQLLQGQVDLLKKKLQVNEKNLFNKQQIETLQLKSDIEMLKKKLQAAQLKVQIKSKEIKQKDKFIVDSIVQGNPEQNKTNPELILAQLQRVLESQLIEKLVYAEKKIKQLENN